MYLGSVVFVIGIITLVLTTKKNIKSKLKITLLAILQFIVSLFLSLMIWRFWIFNFDIMLGFISLPATIAEIATISIIHLIIKKEKALE
jgi:hypothetical protein